MKETEIEGPVGEASLDVCELSEAEVIGCALKEWENAVFA